MVMEKNKTKYKGIVKFAEEYGFTRIAAYKGLERGDPVIWEAYASFREREENEKRNRLNSAMDRIAQVENA